MGHWILLSTTLGWIQVGLSTIRPLATRDGVSDLYVASVGFVLPLVWGDDVTSVCGMS